jgi:hypothetical protein
MNRKPSILRCFVAACGMMFAANLAGAAGDWQQIGQGEIGTLYIQKSAIHNQGDGISLVYRMDFPAPQKNPKTGSIYQSIQVGSTIFCAPRTIARGDLTAFAGTGGSGEVVGTQAIPLAMAKPVPIVKGSSDDDLRRFVCDNKSAKRKS